MLVNINFKRNCTYTHLLKYMHFIQMWHKNLFFIYYIQYTYWCNTHLNAPISVAQITSTEMGAKCYHP